MTNNNQEKLQRKIKHLKYHHEHGTQYLSILEGHIQMDITTWL